MLSVVSIKRQNTPSDFVTFARLTNIQSSTCGHKCLYLFFFCGQVNPPGHSGPGADPELCIKSLKSSPSVVSHSAHHKPTMECYGKFMGELSIKY